MILHLISMFVHMCVQIRRIVTTAAILPDNKTLILNPRFRENTNKFLFEITAEMQHKERLERNALSLEQTFQKYYFYDRHKKWVSCKCILHILLSALRRYYPAIYGFLAFIALCQLWVDPFLRCASALWFIFFRSKIIYIYRIRQGYAKIENFTFF